MLSCLWGCCVASHQSHCSLVHLCPSAGGQYTSLCPCWTFNLTCLDSAAHDTFINPGVDGMWRRTRGRHFTCCLCTAHALQKTSSPVDSVTESFCNKDVVFDAFRLDWVHVVGFYVQIMNVWLYFDAIPFPVYSWSQPAVMWSAILPGENERCMCRQCTRELTSASATALT